MFEKDPTRANTFKVKGSRSSNARDRPFGDVQRVPVHPGHYQAGRICSGPHVVFIRLHIGRGGSEVTYSPRNPQMIIVFCSQHGIWPNSLRIAGPNSAPVAGIAGTWVEHDGRGVELGVGSNTHMWLRVMAVVYMSGKSAPTRKNVV